MRQQDDELMAITTLTRITPLRRLIRRGIPQTLLCGGRLATVSGTQLLNSSSLSGTRGTAASALVISASSYEGNDVATLYEGGLG